MMRILTRLIGRRYFHSRVNNWSILKRGNVHLNHIISQMIKAVLPKYQKSGGMKSITWLNPSQPPICNGIHPPRNTVAAIEATMNMFIYSARKKKANLIPEYSVWKPAVSSDSASARSNGPTSSSTSGEVGMCWSISPVAATEISIRRCSRRPCSNWSFPFSPTGSTKTGETSSRRWT